MIKRGRKRDFYLELLIAASIFIVCSAFLIFTDFFEWWFKYTRAHEGWELDELFSLVFALLIAGSRVLLGVHTVSQAAAGLAFGAAVYFLVWLAVNRFRHSKFVKKHGLLE